MAIPSIILACQELFCRLKLYIPAVWAKLVHRPRLINRLDQGQQLGHKLALISAPAGFGKSTLVSEWITAGKRPAGWLSLDEGDNDPARFLTYLIAALRTINPSIGEGVPGSQQASQTPANESILTVLLNEITAIPDKFVLVLDDYHVIDSQAANGSISEDTLTDVDGILTFLLEHLPPQMQLVIATREDPRLPLARLRGRGQLTELRAADLRFTPGEAAIFLNQVMGLGLSGTEVAALETRTEGWIAGLQLAALSMQGREDIPGFIRAFTGDNHYIVDYLVEEVLQRQPERVGSFLLQTSILDRLSGPLCDAVTGQEDGKEMLETLERGNLFVVPLDDKRQWYRYHHLFADVLQARLMEEQPNQLPILHRRASGWYEGNGFPAEAVSHAFTVEDFERAADLVELTWRLMDRRFQSATWLGWAKALPEEQVRARPVLSAGYAWALLDNGELEASEGRLRDAERWLDLMAERDGGSEALPAGMIVANEEEFRSLQVTIANGRAFQAQALDDVPGTLKYTRQALDLLPEDAYFERGIQAAILGLAYWGSGELEAAHRSIADGVDYMWLADNMLFALSGTSTLADIRIAQGRLGEAISTYEQSLQLAMAQGEPMIQGLADLYLGLSELHCERGDLRAARQNLLRSEELGEKAALPRWPYRRQLAWAQIKQAEGDLDGALEMLREAERLYTRHAIPDVRPVAALKTRVWIKQGRSVEALDWVRERKLSVDDELSYLSEFEHITLARVLIGPL